MRIWFPVGLAVLFLSLIGIATTAARVSATPTLSDDPALGLLFDSLARGTFWMRPDGGDQKQVFSFADSRLPDEALDRASLSPDGKKLWFISTVPDNYALYGFSLLDLDTGNITQLTADQPWILDPHWSSDGSKIAYARGGFGTSVNIIDVDSGNEWLVASIEGMGLSEYYSMNWSPDSSRLALAYLLDEERVGYPGIFVVNADGSDFRLVTTAGEPGTAPAWDASGSVLYYACRGAAGRLTAICLLDLNRALYGRLADMADYVPDQEWLSTLAVSPGGQIAFTHSAYFGPSNHIFVFNPNSGEVRRIQVDDAAYSQPQWAYHPVIP